MELIQKKYKEIDVTDIEVMFLGGQSDVTRVGPDDTFMIGIDAIVIEVRHPQTKETLERITHLKRNMLSHRVVQRKIKVEDR